MPNFFESIPVDTPAPQQQSAPAQAKNFFADIPAEEAPKVSSTPIADTRVKAPEPTDDDIITGKVPGTTQAQLDAAEARFKRQHVLDTISKPAAERVIEGVKSTGSALSDISPSKVATSIRDKIGGALVGGAEFLQHPIEGTKAAAAGLASSAVKGTHALADIGMGIGQKALEYGTSQYGVTPEWAAEAAAEVALARKKLSAGVEKNTSEAKGNSTTDNVQNVAQGAELLGDVAQLAVTPGVKGLDKGVSLAAGGARKLGGAILEKGAALAEKPQAILDAAKAPIKALAKAEGGAVSTIADLAGTAAGVSTGTKPLALAAEPLRLAGKIAKEAPASASILPTLSTQATKEASELGPKIQQLEELKATLEGSRANAKHVSELDTQISKLAQNKVAAEHLAGVTNWAANSPVVQASKGVSKMLANIAAGSAIGATTAAATGGDVNEGAAGGAIAGGALHALNVTKEVFSRYKPKAPVAAPTPQAPAGSPSAAPAVATPPELPTTQAKVSQALEQNAPKLDAVYEGVRPADAGKAEQINGSKLKSGDTVQVLGEPMTVVEPAKAGNPAILVTEEGLGVPVLAKDTIHIDEGSLKPGKAPTKGALTADEELLAGAGGFEAGSGSALAKKTGVTSNLGSYKNGEMIPVKSATVASIGHDGKDLLVDYKRRGGQADAPYRYRDVPVETFEALREAASKGKFVIGGVQGKYPFAKR